MPGLVSIARVTRASTSPPTRTGSSGTGRNPRRTPWPVLGLILGLVTLLLPVAGPAAARAGHAATTEASPLTVQLISMSPSTLPKRGKVVLQGTVTNSSSEPWTSINVYPFISYTPITARDQLAEAAASDPATEVGNRITTPGDFASIGDLVPGEHTSFRIAVRVADLPTDGQDGVYWIGVHALGTNSAGSDSLADGRARTFIPRVTVANAHASAAIVVPVREEVRRDATGRLVDASGWSDSLAPTGRLGRIAGFLSSAGALSETVLLDPAVLDAVADLSAGNPPLSLGTSTKPTSTASPSRSQVRPNLTDQTNAAAWLVQVIAAARAHTALGLGYADPDVSALARHRPTLLKLAARLAAQTFSSLNIPALPAVAPPDGWLDDASLSSIQPETVVLVSDHAAPRTRTIWRTGKSQNLVFTDAKASTGGPGPTDPLAPLALRQQIISDAALSTQDPSGGPLVISLPAGWDPGTDWQQSNFFAGLDVPWLNLVGLDPSAAAGTPTIAAPLGYPTSARRQEVRNANVKVAQSLVTTGNVLNRLLRSTNTVGHAVPGFALDSVSYHARGDQLAARNQAAATNDDLRATMAKVGVLGTDFVTLSGGSGTLAVTLVNGLDQPITVGISARTSTGDVHIEPIKPIKMAAGEHTVLRLRADASSIGVTEVTLVPVTSNGQAAGTPLTFSLRTSQVGNLIWGVLAAGALVLVILVGRRIRQRIRERLLRRAGTLA
ncbi:MAG: hypothetical protein JWQ32_1233 [Marmoricola sp.]|nr:hypothetical protein [Marmoricola sp.]